MKPLKNFENLATWLLRINILVVLIVLYFTYLKTAQFTNIAYIVTLAYGLSSILLILGGLQKKATLTIISGILLFGIACYKVGSNFNIHDTIMYLHVFIGSVGLLFVSKGNG